MSESDSGAKTPKRLAPPFPSRTQVHGTRIPRGDEEAQPSPEPDIPVVTSPLPKRREAPRRPRTTTRQQPAERIEAEQTNLPTPLSPDLTPGDVQPADPQVELPRPETPAEADPEEAFIISEGITFQPVLPQGQEAVPVKPNDPQSPLTTEATGNGATDTSREVPFPKRVSPVTGTQPALAPDERQVREKVRQAGEKNKRQRKNRRRIWTIAIVILVLVLAGFAGYWAFQGLRGAPVIKQDDDYPAVDWDAAAAEHPLVEVTVEPGQIGSEIGTTLYEADVVKTVKAFTRAFDANPASSSIKPGTYSLPIKIPAAEALAGLLDETNRSENTITVNPGQTLKQIAEKMVTVAGFSASDVEETIESPASVSALPEEAGGNLEGWLWPGSYEFSPSSSPAELFTKMVEPTVAFLKDNDVPADQWEDVLIQASIVEREVNREEDMPKVARVIVNRIEDPEGPTRGMLQMDSTVTYGVGGTGGLPDSAAFEDDNPYNTYRVKGLPAGPIASPSEAAILAVLSPAEGNWFYFVTVNLHTGETIFTDSHEELQVLTEQLVEWCENNPGECRE